MGAMNELKFQKWLESQPSKIQTAAKRWPAGPYRDDIYGGTVFVLGWAERAKDGGVDLIISHIDPDTNYDMACRMRDHLETEYAEVHFAPAVTTDSQTPQ